jgi:hypothetical protein
MEAQTPSTKLKTFIDNIVNVQGEIYWLSVGSDRNDVLALLSDLNLMLSSQVENMTDSIQASALLKKK